MSSLSTETQYNRVLSILQNEHGNTKNLIKKYSGEYDLVREFSPSRSNAIAWLPFQREDEVLELNAGCGAASEYLTHIVLKNRRYNVKSTVSAISPRIIWKFIRGL